MIHLSSIPVNYVKRFSIFNVNVLGRQNDYPWFPTQTQYIKNKAENSSNKNFSQLSTTATFETPSTDTNLEARTAQFTR